MFRSVPSELSPEVWQAVENWQKRENSLLFAFILDPQTEIDRHVAHHVGSEQCPLPTPVDTIDVLVESTGGDIEAAYKLVMALRHQCKRLRMLIPFYAKSAATFLCLGADEILMTIDAEIGPLDAQIQDPRHPDRMMSALEQFIAIDHLRQHGYEMLDQFCQTTARRTRMNIEDILAHAVQYTTQMMQGLYQNIDPLDFGVAERALNMSNEYGRRIMRRFAYRNMADSDLTDLLQTLTWEYPSHSFVIDYIEAKQLGLNVALMTNEQACDSRNISLGIKEAIGFFDIDREEETDEQEEVISVLAVQPEDRDGVRTPKGRTRSNGRRRSRIASAN
jgi:ATP-dependent protease ClpP protease subunit